MAIDTRIETLPDAVLLCIFRSRALSLNVQSCLSVGVHARSTWHYMYRAARDVLGAWLVAGMSVSCGCF